MRRNRILVTGVFGFIGSAFAKLILGETDWHVVGFGRQGESGNTARLAGLEGHPRLSLIRGDLCDASALSGICEDIDHVVHFAAKTFVDHAIVDPKPFIDSNIFGTYNLLEQARKYQRGIKRFVQVSTDEVYGSILNGAYKEDAPLNPTNPYSAAKAGGDMLAVSYHNTYGLPILVTRTENNYGPWQHRQKAIPTFVRHALQDEPLPIYGDGLHVRQWIHVGDHCRAILHLLQHGEIGQIYHVAGNQELTNLELAKTVLGVLGKPETMIRHIDDRNARPGHDRRYALDSSRLRALGWKPLVDLQVGLVETVEWYARHQ